MQGVAKISCHFHSKTREHNQGNKWKFWWQLIQDINLVKFIIHFLNFQNFKFSKASILLFLYGQNQLTCHAPQFPPAFGWWLLSSEHLFFLYHCNNTVLNNSKNFCFSDHAHLHFSKHIEHHRELCRIKNKLHMYADHII